MKTQLLYSIRVKRRPQAQYNAIKSAIWNYQVNGFMDFGFGVGPRELIDIKGIIVDSAFLNRPILNFSRAKMVLLENLLQQQNGIISMIISGI